VTLERAHSPHLHERVEFWLGHLDGHLTLRVLRGGVNKIRFFSLSFPSLLLSNNGLFRRRRDLRAVEVVGFVHSTWSV